MSKSKKKIIFKKSILSIEVLHDDENKYMNKLRVHFGDETRKYHFTYDISTLQITSSNCNHAELYKNDFKRIVVKIFNGYGYI